MLVQRGAEVVALVRDGLPNSLFYSATTDWNLQSRVTTVHGQLEDFDLLRRSLIEYEIDTVFHLAAQTIVGYANRDPLSTFKSNIEGSWNVLEACRLAGSGSGSIQRVIVASSDKAYGNLEGEEYDETFPLRGEHPYDVSKSCSDLLARMYFKSFNLPVCITRCGNFFGPGDLNFSRIVPGIIQDILNDRRPRLRSDGTPIRDYIYVEDGAHAYLTLAEAMRDGTSTKPRSAILGEAFNFSYNLRIPALEMTNRILELMERTDLSPDIRNEAKNEIPVQCLNSDKARHWLKWEPKYGLDVGLKKTIDWYRQFLEQKKR